MARRFLNIVIPPVPQTLTYELAEGLTPRPEVGYRVSVPLGRRYAAGFVVGELSAEEAQKLPFALKTIQKLQSSYPFFLPDQISFFQWIADYYGSDLGTVVDVAVPQWVAQKFSKKVRLIAPPSEPPRGKLERAIIDWLSQAKDPVDQSLITRRHKGAGTVLKRLLEKGVIKVEESELLDHHLQNVPAPAWAKGAVSLTGPQHAATEKICGCIDAGTSKTFLLHGVTGSGKTEVYIEAIRHATSKGLGALIIVPEIALTPQLVDRFRARLGENIAVLHSALQQRARWDAWRALLDGRCLIAIGARSGIFAPLRKTGIIIVDEEHDGSYKQGEGLRYNARDLAVVRGKLENCPVVLGSATPSLETFQHARDKRYDLLSLPSRPGGMGSTEIRLLDLNRIKPWEMASRGIAPAFYDALHDALERKEQAFVLYNRRGFAAYLQCEKCETVLKCRNCSVPLTFHRFNNSLLCHYCSLSMLPPDFCPECAAKGASAETCGKLTQRGSGTEHVYDELKTLFPHARIDRLDRDSVDNIDDYRRILGRVRSGETDILVGTQMIAKGHDLPGVTFVGIVDCDVGLHLPDFRASERVFQLLTQAAGRAGRGDKPGLIMLQTRVPVHPALTSTVAHDYLGFARQELTVRQSIGYPPFCRMLRIVCSSTEKTIPPAVLQDCRTFIERYAELQKLEVRILGPAAAPLEKLKTSWRAHLLLKSKSAAALNAIARVINAERSQSTKYRLILDMDPQDMM